MNHQTRATTQKRLEEENVREKLLDIQADPSFNSELTSFTANTVLYPDGQIPFVQKHLDYLMAHPKLDPNQYLSNLRLMLRKR